LSKKKQTICLKDCECIGLSISDSVIELEKVFDQAGSPEAIIKD